MPFIELDGSKVFFQDKGRGTPILLIHGACEDSEFWKFQIGHLGSWRTIAVDLPGHGQSGRLPNTDSIPSYASFIDKFARALGLQRFVVAGHSMGGAIAIQLTLEYSSKLGGSVLCNTGAKLGVLPRIIAGLQENPKETLQGIILPRAVFNNPRLASWILKRSLMTRDDACGLDYKACNEFDKRNDLDNIRLPALIVAGEHDQMTPVQWSAFMHQKIVGSSLVIVKRSSHMTMLERPSIFNRNLKEFLKQLDNKAET